MLLYHRDLGGTGRPPLVILHGMLGSSRNWQTTGRDLAEKYHVLALDLRNHGDSPHASEMSYAAMVEDVIGWLDAQQLTRVTLLGHSMGGKVAMLLACRHPERVAGLIVVDIAPKDYRWPAHREEFAAMNELDLASLESRAAGEQAFESRISDWAMRKFAPPTAGGSGASICLFSRRRWPRWSPIRSRPRTSSPARRCSSPAGNPATWSPAITRRSAVIFRRPRSKPSRPPDTIRTSMRARHLSPSCDPPSPEFHPHGTAPNRLAQNLAIP
jgi:pimeloyl-ACP methyl ester carboxylesterase